MTNELEARMADRRYETLVLIHPEQGEAGAKELNARIRTLIEEQGGSVSQVQDWGQRDLAYLVAKQRRAFYALFEYRATPKALQEVERNLTLMDQVLRYVSVRQAENAPPAPPLRTARRPDREEGEGTDEPGDEAGVDLASEGEMT
jgi:small subunit ribosomal protein S6